MDERKLKKITKRELLEILLSQAKRIEELELELEDCNEKIKSKEIKIDNVGSIAEASMQLNGIFEAAQATIDQYMANVYDKCKKLEDDTKEECQRLKTEALEYVAQFENSKNKLLGKKKNKISKSTNKVESVKIKNKSSKGMKKRKVSS